MVTLALVTFAAWWFTVVLVAELVGWPRAVAPAAVSALSLLALYATRRHAVDVWMRRQADHAASVIESLPWQNDDHG